MPSLGADMESGTLLEWRVKPGDAVKRGDIVAVVDTSKAEIEVEIFEDGVIEELLVPVGDRVPVGTVLATVRALGAAVAAPAIEAAVAAPASPTAVAAPANPTAVAAAANPPAVAAPASPAVVAPEPAVAVPAASGHRLRVSPLARRVAVELGVDLSSVHGSGPNGAINRSDVEHAAPPRPVGHIRATAVSRPNSADHATRTARPHPRARRDAYRDRRADGPLEARDPALLPPA